MHENETDNVVEMATKRPQKVTMAERQNQIAIAMDHEDLSPFVRFPAKFHAIERSPGVKDIIEDIGDGVCVNVGIERVADAIQEYTLTELSDNRYFRWVRTQCMSAANFWLGRTQVVPVPPPFRQLSDKQLCYHRLEWDIDPLGWHSTPLFNSFLSQVKTNQAQLCQFIGSLFDPKSDRQQYLWLYGEGGNGKGSLMKLLRRVFAGSYQAEQANGASENRFWTSGLLSKRLVVFQDCNSPTFPTSGIFKQLSGGDPIRIEKKGEQPYTAALDAKFIFVSNQPPMLSSQEADMRRAIFCEVGPLPPGVSYDPAYEENLWKEAQDIIGGCVFAYMQQMQSHGRIEPDREAIADMAVENEMPYQMFLSEFFRIAETEEEMVMGCTGQELAECFDRWSHTNRDAASNKWRSNFRLWLKRRYRIDRSKGRNNAIYAGLIKLSHSERGRPF
jgi:hypothetical protein